MASKQNKTALSHETVWVIGCGQFGRRAVELLKESAPASNIVVIDNLPSTIFPKI